MDRGSTQRLYRLLHKGRSAGWYRSSYSPLERIGLCIATEARTDVFRFATASDSRFGHSKWNTSQGGLASCGCVSVTFCKERASPGTHLPRETCHGTADVLGSIMRNHASQYRWSLLWLSAYLTAAGTVSMLWRVGGAQGMPDKRTRSRQAAELGASL